MNRIDGIFKAMLLTTAATLVPFAAHAQSTGTPTSGTPSPDTKTTATSVTSASAATQPNQDSGIQDIIVTARRSEENIQKTPVAVTALNELQLERAQVTNQLDLQRTTPSLVISKGAPSSSGFVYVSIRGQGNLNPGVANDPAVGTYVDGVYIPRPSQGITDLDDIKRVEILRGPQGTLFGRNTTGGALNIISSDPTGKFEGTLTGEYGNFNGWKAGGVLNAPLKGDELGIRVTYSHSQHDGFARNVILNRDQNDSKSDFVRGKLRWAPAGSAFSIVLEGDYNRITDSGAANSLAYADASAAGPIAALTPAFGPFAPVLLLPVYAQFAQYLHAQNNFYTGYATGFSSNSTPNGGRLPYDTLTAYGGSATINLALGDLKLKSITGYRHSYNEGLIDLDATPIDLIATRSGYNSNAFSQEFQLSGNVGDHFDFITGAYYSRETGFEFSDFETFAFLNAILGAGPALTGQNYATVTNKTFGAYAQGYYKVTDKLRVAAGLRWTFDTRDVALSNIAQNGLPYGTPLPPQASPVTGFNCVNANATTAALAATCRLPRSAKFDYPAYTLGLDYQAQDNLFLYAKTSRASKAGGWNLRQGSEGTPAFAPETAKDVEAGFKYTTPNRVFRLNAAGFYTWTNNVQRNSSAFVDGHTTQFLRNAGKTEIWGGEFEATLIPVDGLEINGNVALLDGKYVKGTFFDDYGGGVTVDRSNENLPQLPHFQGGVGATQTIPLSFGKLAVHADFAYIGSQYFSPATPPPGVGPGILAAYAVANAATHIPGYGLLNARVGATFDNGIEVYVFSKNLTDKKYVVHSFADLYPQIGIATEYVGDPAVYGAGIKFKF